MKSRVIHLWHNKIIIEFDHIYWTSQLEMLEKYPVFEIHCSEHPHDNLYGIVILYNDFIVEDHEYELFKAVSNLLYNFI
jgi:hypothetical protein